MNVGRTGELFFKLSGERFVLKKRNVKKDGRGGLTELGSFLSREEINVKRVCLVALLYIFGYNFVSV